MVQDVPILCFPYTGGPSTGHPYTGRPLTGDQYTAEPGTGRTGFPVLGHAGLCLIPQSA